VTNELLRRGEVVVDGDSVRARQVANQLAIKNAIEKYGVKKIFSFHGRVRSAESFTSDRPEGINSIIADLPAFHVNGKMKAADRETIMDEFSAGATGIVSNARCLTEGVAVPAVDMVAFMSPKKSKIDIVQATGRAMRRPRGKSDKKIGYVFVPLYVEQAKEETIEEAIKRLDFEELADVLNAMKEQDEVLVDILREMREERGRVGGYDDNRFREKVEVIGDLVALDALYESITTMCVDRLGVTWDERYGQLVAFKEEHGHCNVPIDYDTNAVLGRWCHTQRQLKRQYRLKPDRMARLKSVGFEFDLIAAKWEELYQLLISFKNQYGHCNVPKSYEAVPKLGRWCNTLRTLHNQGRLSSDRIDRLTSIGFSFGPLAEQWEEMFQALTAFKVVHGHCNVPQNYETNSSLGAWCDRQRQYKRQGKLSPDRIERLESNGFDFDPYATEWEQMFQALIAFKEEHGHCNVLQLHDSNVSLGRWCSLQRQYKRQGKLSPDRIERLESNGFNFDRRAAQWEEMFQALIAFKEEHGHCNVPAKYSVSPRLGAWCRKQRKLMTQSLLSTDRIARLESIGFDFDPRESQWEKMFQVLIAFKEEHGHCNVPQCDETNSSLGAWCTTQRQSQKTGRLSTDGISRLESIGFDFDPLATQWEEMFQTLTAFKEEHGHSNVPAKYSANRRLGRWCRKQRLNKKQGKLSKDRVALLNSIGFKWQLR